VDQENNLLKKKEERKRGSSSDSLTDDDDSASDFLEDQSLYEKKLHILLIPHIILWKTRNESGLKLQDMQLAGNDALDFIYGA